MYAMSFKTIIEGIPKMWLVASTMTSRSLNQPYFLKFSYSQRKGPVTEPEITTKLRQTFPKASLISVEDTSGGCGAMFHISIETDEFKGLSIVKQHRLIYETLKEEIQSIHGLHLETRAPK